MKTRGKEERKRKYDRIYKQKCCKSNEFREEEKKGMKKEEKGGNLRKGCWKIG
jgi:hypothetical protein